MPDLIAAIEGPRPVPGVREELESQYFDIVEAARAVLGQLGNISTLRRSNDGESWGGAMKRLPVKLPGHESTQPMAEVVNQCATVERLLDALEWVERHDRWEGWEVVLCHPTTSSSRGVMIALDTGDVPDHDLVLRGDKGQLAIFEVSDVASPRDNNGKTIKDLLSLGVLDTDKEATTPGHDRVAARFLVVSPDREPAITRMRRATTEGEWRFTTQGVSGKTCVVEAVFQSD